MMLMTLSGVAIGSAAFDFVALFVFARLDLMISWSAAWTGSDAILLSQRRVCFRISCRMSGLIAELDGPPSISSEVRLFVPHLFAIPQRPEHDALAPGLEHDRALPPRDHKSGDSLPVSAAIALRINSESLLTDLVAGQKGSRGRRARST